MKCNICGKEKQGTHPVCRECQESINENMVNLIHKSKRKQVKYQKLFNRLRRAGDEQWKEKEEKK